MDHYNRNNHQKRTASASSSPYASPYGQRPALDSYSVDPSSVFPTDNAAPTGNTHAGLARRDMPSDHGAAATFNSSDLTVYASSSTAPAAASVAAAPRDETLYEALLRYHEEEEDSSTFSNDGKMPPTANLKHCDSDDESDRKPAAKPIAKSAAKPTNHLPQNSNTFSGVSANSSFQPPTQSQQPVIPAKSSVGSRPPSYRPTKSSDNNEPRIRQFATNNDNSLNGTSRHGKSSPPPSPLKPSARMLQQQSNSTSNDDRPPAITSFYEAAMKESRMLEQQQQQQARQLPRPGAVMVSEPVARPDSAVYRSAFGTSAAAAAAGSNSRSNSPDPKAKKIFPAPMGIEETRAAVMALKASKPSQRKLGNDDTSAIAPYSGGAPSTAVPARGRMNGYQGNARHSVSVPVQSSREGGSVQRHQNQHHHLNNALPQASGSNYAGSAANALSYSHPNAQARRGTPSDAPSDAYGRISPLTSKSPPRHDDSYRYTGGSNSRSNSPSVPSNSRVYHDPRGFASTTSTSYDSTDGNGRAYYRSQSPNNTHPRHSTAAAPPQIPFNAPPSRASSAPVMPGAESYSEQHEVMLALELSKNETAKKVDRTSVDYTPFGNPRLPGGISPSYVADADEGNSSLQDIMLALKLSTEENNMIGGNNASTNMDELLALEVSRYEQGTHPQQNLTDYVAAGISTNDMSKDIGITSRSQKLAAAGIAGNNPNGPSSNASQEEQLRILRQIQEEQERKELEMALRVSRQEADTPMQQQQHHHQQHPRHHPAPSGNKAQDFLRSQQMAIEEYAQRGRHQHQQQPPQPKQQNYPKQTKSNNAMEKSTDVNVGKPKRSSSVASVDSTERTRELMERGTVETRNAISSGQAHVVTCQGCRGKLQAPMNYSLVFCPKCKTISPA